MYSAHHSKKYNYCSVACDLRSCHSALDAESRFSIFDLESAIGKLGSCFRRNNSSHLSSGRALSAKSKINCSFAQGFADYDNMSYIEAILALFAIVEPTGNIPILLDITPPPYYPI